MHQVGAEMGSHGFPKERERERTRSRSMPIPVPVPAVPGAAPTRCRPVAILIWNGIGTDCSSHRYGRSSGRCCPFPFPFLAVPIPVFGFPPFVPSVLFPACDHRNMRRQCIRGGFQPLFGGLPVFGGLSAVTFGLAVGFLRPAVAGFFGAGAAALG